MTGRTFMQGGARTLAACVVATATAAAAQTPLPGERLFRQQCAACHAIVKGEEHRQGPNLWGVIGRPAGTAPGFSYSPAFTEALAGQPWTAQRVDRWLTDPKAIVPDTMMVYRQDDAGVRASLIEYLNVQH